MSYVLEVEAAGGRGRATLREESGDSHVKLTLFVGHFLLALELMAVGRRETIDDNKMFP